MDLKQTLFIICSDHGHTGIADTEKKYIKVGKIADVLSACGVDARDPKSDLFRSPVDDNTCLIKDTAGLMHIFLRKGLSENYSWRQPPDASHVKSLLHLLCAKVQQQSQNEKEDRSGIGNRLLQGIDAILYHDYQQNNYQIHYLRRGAYSPGEPIAEDVSQGAEYLPMKTLLDEMTCGNSGDIILIPRYLEGFRFESKEATNSTHGSFARSDMLVPLIIASPFNPDLIDQHFADVVS